MSMASLKCFVVSRLSHRQIQSYMLSQMIEYLMLEHRNPSHVKEHNQEPLTRSKWESLRYGIVHVQWLAPLNSAMRAICNY